MHGVTYRCHHITVGQPHLCTTPIDFDQLHAKVLHVGGDREELANEVSPRRRCAARTAVGHLILPLRLPSSITKAIGETHVAQASLLHLAAPLDGHRYPLLRRRIEKPASRPDLIVAHYLSMLLYSDLEQRLPAPQCVEHRQGLPKSLAILDERADGLSLIRVPQEMVTDDRTPHRKVPDLVDARAALDIGDGGVERTPLSFAHLRGGRQHAFHQYGQHHDAGDKVVRRADRLGELLERGQDALPVPVHYSFDEFGELFRRHTEFDDVTADDACVPGLVEKLRDIEFHFGESRGDSYQVCDRTGRFLLRHGPEGHLIDERLAQGARPL